MEKNYFNFSTEELLDDRKFVAWLARGENHKEWELYLAEHPEIKPRVSKAREILNLLRDQTDHLSDEDLLEIWKSIEIFDTQTRRGSRKIWLRVLMRYAALFFLLLFVGSASFWIIYQHQKTYSYISQTDSGSAKQSRLVLSNGKTVDLEKKNSRIALNGDQKIMIDNEKEIDLSQEVVTDDSKMNEVVIPFGKKSQLILSDGTKVWLNAGSRMAFPTKFKGKKREVFLEGEAYFEVTHHKDLPFYVNTSELSVKVLGTRFNITAYESDQHTETVLLEGKVSVSERSVFGLVKGETILSPNQRASYDHADRLITVKSEPDVEFSIAWTEGWFKFSQQSLKEVMNKLQRYYNVHFLFDPEFSTADLISGKLDLKESVDQVMVALSDVANIQFRVDGDKIYVNKKLSVLPMRK